MSKGWWNQSKAHSLARKGVSTKQIKKGTANQTAIKHHLSNAIQNDMLKLDRLLRKSIRTSNIDVTKQHLKEASKIYDRLGAKFQKHKETYGALPFWVNQTWHSKETFKKNGRIKKIMDILENSTPKSFQTNQRSMFQAIKLPTERHIGQYTPAQLEKIKRDSYEQAIKQQKRRNV